MLLRVFAETDRPAVVDLWHDLGLARPWNDPGKDIDRALATWPYLFLVAERDGAVVGTALCGYDGHRGWIYYLAVARPHQSRGIGRALIAEAEGRLTALVGHSNLVTGTQPTMVSTLVLVAWLAGLAAFLGCLGVGAAVSLQRLQIKASTLQIPALLAVPLALVLAIMSACDIAAVILAGDAALFSNVIPVIVVLVVAGTASVTALTSSTRGVRAIRHA
ncbi:GNAT family N-acetyltransferase [bacterium RCC_150]